MMITRKFCRYIHMGRIVPEIDPVLSQQIEQKVLEPWDIPSRKRIGFSPLPAQLEYAALAKIRTVADKTFRQEAKQLLSIMYNLKLPDTKDSLRAKKADILTELEIRDKIRKQPDDLNESDTLPNDIDIAKHELSELIKGKLYDKRRDWHYYEYDDYASTLYMAVRLAPNYACLETIMREIRAADANFQPKSVLDFGSGMGTTIWAVNETWPNSVGEFSNIDISKDQQALCEFLLRAGKYSGEPLPGMFHRQYLPTSTKTKYDIVVSAFTLLEMPNAELRAHTIENLWQKTNEFLVLVERGNEGGFATINEARHLILDLDGRKVTSKINKTYDTRVKPDLKREEAHIVAPCAHEFLCPRISMSSKKRINICRFRAPFEPLDLGEGRGPGGAGEEFSYVVFRKGPLGQPYYRFSEHSDIRWPRIVEPRRRSSGQVTLKLCTPNGSLAETVITKKYGKSIYDVARVCKWGDILPIRVNDTYRKKSTLKDKELLSLNSETSKDVSGGPSEEDDCDEKNSK